MKVEDIKTLTLRVPLTLDQTTIKHLFIPKTFLFILMLISPINEAALSNNHGHNQTIQIIQI
jgi:hypothetical protein